MYCINPNCFGMSVKWWVVASKRSQTITVSLHWSLFKRTFLILSSFTTYWTDWQCMNFVNCCYVRNIDFRINIQNNSVPVNSKTAHLPTPEKSTGIWLVLSSVQWGIWPKMRPAQKGIWLSCPNIVSAVGNKRISKFLDSAHAPHSRVIPRGFFCCCRYMIYHKRPCISRIHRSVSYTHLTLPTICSV